MRTRALAFGCALVSAAATTMIACGGAGQDPGEGRAKATNAAKITALGPATIDGCALGMAFDITAPASIGVVGIAPLDGLATPPALSLYAVDEFGQEQLVASVASQVSGTLASLLSRAFSSDTLVAGDNASSVHAANRNGATSAVDAVRNGTSLTTSESGSYARDTYGDQALLHDSLAAAGWGTEPVAGVALPLVASSLDGTASSVGVERGVSNTGFSDVASGTYGSEGLGSFGNTVGDSNAWANRSVETGIGRLNVRENWGSGDALSSQSGSDAFSVFGNNANVAQGASTSSYTAEQAIANAVAYSSLDSLNSRHFVLRVQAEALGGAAGFRVFQGTEALLFATEDANVALPACDR